MWGVGDDVCRIFAQEALLAKVAQSSQRPASSSASSDHAATGLLTAPCHSDLENWVLSKTLPSSSTRMSFRCSALSPALWVAWSCGLSMACMWGGRELLPEPPCFVPIGPDNKGGTCPWAPPDDKGGTQ